MDLPAPAVLTLQPVSYLPPPRSPWPARHRLLTVLAACLVLAAGGVGVARLFGGPGLAPIADRFASPRPAPPVPGVEGSQPGGPAVWVPVAVQNPSTRSLTVTAVHPDLTAAPATCPARAWQIDPAAAAPVLAPGAGTTLFLVVALTPDAPESCQGVAFTVPVDVTASGPGGDPVHLPTAAALTAATLGTPSGTVRVVDGRVVVSAVASAGPTPSTWGVDVVGPDGTRLPLCRTQAAQPCTDTGAPAASARAYVVTVGLGRWHRDSPVVHGWTPPPAPQLALAGPGDGERLGLYAVAAQNDYELVVAVDGRRVGQLTVPAMTGLDVVVPLPGLSAGRHRVEVTTSAGGLRSTVAVAFTTRSSGA